MNLSFSSNKTKFQKITPRMLYFHKYAAIDRINYPYKVATLTSNLLMVKSLLNSVISTRGPRLCSIDIKIFYLCTPLKFYEYV
ncbi:hypothetical protein ACHAW6_012057 [Cyclotella cf. meneghiniana]